MNLTKHGLLSIISEQLKNVESDIDEMARLPKYEFYEINPPIVIDKNELIRGDNGGTVVDPISTFNPGSNENEEDVIYGVKGFGILNHNFIRFKNNSKIDPKSGERKWPGKDECVYLNPNGQYEYYPTVPPRNAKFGTPWTKEGKVSKDPEELAKRYVIYPPLKAFSNDPEVINKLESCVIPIPLIHGEFTERLGNKIQTQSFGGKNGIISFRFEPRVEYKTIHDVLNKIIDNRMAAATGEQLRKQQTSKTPRVFDVVKGQWSHSQSIENKDSFKHHGEYTKILRLFKKNIRRGEADTNVVSVFKVEGIPREDGYLLRVTYFPVLNYRSGENSSPSSKGNLIPNIVEQKIAPFPEGYDQRSIVINKETVEYFKQLFNDVITQLKSKVLTIDADEVTGKILQLLQTYDEENEIVQREPMREIVKRKIALTESQLHRVMDKLNEEEYDDMINSGKDTQREISMSHDDAMRLINFGQDWCKGKENHPDCQEIEELRDKLKLY